MAETPVIVFYGPRLNKNSLIVLLAALEAHAFFDELQTAWVTHEKALLSLLADYSHKGRRTVVCLSFFTTQLWDMYPLIQKIKADHAENCFLLAGGAHPTGDPAGTLHMGCDAVVLGEGERTVPELLHKLCRGADYRDTPGIAYRDASGNCLHNAPQAPIALEQFPPFAVKHGRHGPIEITRGCPFGCGFCQTPRIFPGSIRHRSLDAICTHVGVLKSRNLTDIRFVTPNAFSYGSADGRLLNLAALDRLFRTVKDSIRPAGRLFIGSFPSEVRPEHVCRETLELVRAYGDNDNIVIGAQSGSQRILDLCRRGHSVDDIYRAVELTCAAGRKALVDFIFGLPGETDEDIRQTIKVMRDLSRLGARMHVHAFMPFPQTPFAGKRPAGISAELKRQILLLVSRGHAFGAWQQQERDAFRIARYLEGGRGP